MIGIPGERWISRAYMASNIQASRSRSRCPRSRRPTPRWRRLGLIGPTETRRPRDAAERTHPGPPAQPAAGPAHPPRRRRDADRPDRRGGRRRRGGVRGDPQPAAARRPGAAEPRDLRDHVDAVHRRPADGRDRRQEHDRQGRVPADRGDRGPLRQHPRRPVGGARARERHRLLDDRLQRGGDARGHGAEVALAGTAPAGRPGRGPAQPGDGRKRPGLLGEVLPLLGGRAPAGGAGGRDLPPDPRTGARAL